MMRGEFKNLIGIAGRRCFFLNVAFAFLLLKPALSCASDPPTAFTEAFSREFETQLLESDLPLAYSEKADAWGQSIVRSAWMLIQQDLVSSSIKTNNANKFSGGEHESLRLLARSAVQLLDDRREKTFSTLSAPEALKITRLTLLIAQAATPFECAQIFRKKSPSENKKGRSFIKLASTLSVEDFETYLMLRAKALERFVRGNSEFESLESLEAARIIEGYRDNIWTLVKKDLRLLGLILAGGKYANLPDQDVCRYGLALLHSVVSGDLSVSQKKALLFVQGKLK